MCICLQTYSTPHHLRFDLKTVDPCLSTYSTPHHLRSDLKTDEDQKVNQRVKDILIDLSRECRVRSSKLQGASESMFRPDLKVQDMLRNLGAFEVCMTVLELESSIKEGDKDENNKKKNKHKDATLEPEELARLNTADALKRKKKDEAQRLINENIREILRLCNGFLAWFVCGNAKNQQLAFVELDAFTEALGDDVLAHKVVSAIFRGNHELVKAFPLKLITTCAFELSKNPDPGYLDVLEALVWQDSHDAPGNLQVQMLILKSLIEPEYEDQIMILCTEKDSEAYEARKSWMEEAMQATANSPSNQIGSDDPCAHMPTLLEYHTKLMNVLAGTALGRANVATVEAKLQTLYSTEDLLHVLLDPSTTIDGLIPLANYFNHACIDVEIGIPGLGKDRDMWRYLVVCKEVLQNSKADFEFLSNHPLDASMKAIVARRNCIYALICTRIVCGFLSLYYERTELDEDFTLDEDSTPMENNAQHSHHADAVARLNSTQVDENELEIIEIEATRAGQSPVDDAEDDEDFGRLPIVKMWWDDLINDLRDVCLDIYQMDAKILETEDFRVLYEAIEATTNASIDVNIDMADILPPGALNHLTGSFEARGDSGTVPVTIELTEQEIQFKTFVDQISSNSQIQASIEMDKLRMVESLELVPSMFEDDTKGDLRFGPFIKDLVRHTRANLSYDGMVKALSPDCTKSTTWFIRLFRSMIEKKWGMTIDERDDDGGEEEDEKGGAIQHMLNVCGITELCIDLIATGIDSMLVRECVKLLVALLFKEGGATEVQKTIHKHLIKDNSQLFFQVMVAAFEAMNDVFKFEELPGISMDEKARSGGTVDPSNVDLDEDDEDPLEQLPVVKENIIIIRFLQLMCEGHYKPNQEISGGAKGPRGGVDQSA